METQSPDLECQGRGEYKRVITGQNWTSDDDGRRRWPTMVAGGGRLPAAVDSASSNQRPRQEKNP